MEDPGHFEALYAAAEYWPALRARYRAWFDGVPLDSPGAVQARQQQEQLRALQNDRPPPIASNPASQIRSWLAEAEAGRWQAWWQLSYYLMLTPESRAFGEELDYFVTAMPGWGEADKSLRRRIVAASERYLAEAETGADEWLGRVPMPPSATLSADCGPSFSSSSYARGLRSHRVRNLEEMGAGDRRTSPAARDREFSRNRRSSHGRAQPSPRGVRRSRSHDHPA